MTPPPPRLDDGAEPLIVVGVGASAGGLAATTELLRHLGDAPGIAIVVLHHLDPSHESALGELLAKTTSLPVETIRDGTRVRLDRVYVVPANTALEISKGTLCLSARDDRGGVPLPIDRFFESLAADRTVQAIGVVLTGTGADGTMGIRAIKAEGGVTFAQDGALHGEMPASAIGTRCVDFVLPLSGIARELRRIGETNRLRAPADDDEDDDFARVLSVLRQSSGIDFANYKHSTLRRRVQRRQIVRGSANLSEYATLVEHDADEMRVLGDEVLIHVTSFFRDPDVFAALRATVFPRLLENRASTSSIRVWVPGCSTGEEVYSLAISLLEFLAEADAEGTQIKLFGTDVSASAIERARAGRYAASIERDVSAARLERYFARRDDGYQIQPGVRDLCIFARHDATRDPPFAGMDLISCRNLLIYLGTPLQDRILPTFHYSLVDSGILVLGTSETVRTFPGFAPVDGKHRIYARTSSIPRRIVDVSEPRDKAAAVHGPSSSARAASTLDIGREADRVVLAQSAPPGVVVSDDLAVVQFRGRTGAFLEPTPGTANLDLLRIVREDLRLTLRQTIDAARAKEGVACASVLVGPGHTSRVDVEVIPFRATVGNQRYFVVLFREASLPALAPVSGDTTAGARHELAARRLEEELASTRSYLQAAVEQLEASNEELKSANEEIVSSNEELRSTNEELQMAKEELQATNEELRTVNDEMLVRNVEATRLGDDLNNVLNSVEIPIVLLGRDSRVRRFTPAAGLAFHLIATDVGRPLSDIRAIVAESILTEMIAEVLQRLAPVSRTVLADDGRWNQLTVRPYQTNDNRIDGTVISTFDIDGAKRASMLVAEARSYAESVVDSVRDELLVLDEDRRVRSANRAFYRTFGGTPHDVEGRRLDEIGHGEWNIPALLSRLDQLGENEGFDGVRVEAEFARAGWRVFVLTARRIEGTSSLLLALEDITERERAARSLKETEDGFLEMLTSIGEAIYTTDERGTIVFANRMAHTMFGYASGGLVGALGSTLVQPRDRRAGDPVDTRASSLGRAGHRDMSGRRLDGSHFPVETVEGAMLREGISSTMTFVTDVTRQREAEKTMSDYRGKLREMAFDATLTEQRERRKIAADLHDRIGQSLTLSMIKLTSVRESIEGATRVAVDEAVALLGQSITDTRELIFELSPPVLHELGLEDALGWLVEDVEKRYGLRARLVVEDDELGEIDEATANIVFRAIRELLINVSKHARSHDASVVLRRRDERLEIEVEDDGVGFDGSRASWTGFGLFSVREQIQLLGGAVEISSSPGHGTRISLRVPIERKPTTHPEEQS